MQTKGFLRSILRTVVLAVMMVLVLFLSAGTWNWLMGWVFVAMMVLVQVANTAGMLASHPDLIEERNQMGENTEPWDRVLSVIVALVGPLATWLVAGLDKRFGWSGAFPPAVPWIALGIGLAGALFASWAMSVNRFFAATVRIQNDRGHQVVSSGPYALMRHPGYAGALVYNLALPFLLESVWTLVPVVLLLIALFVRTSKEDAKLQAELPGYQDYAGRVRSRLIPGVW